jgi:hypothetical protein
MSEDAVFGGGGFLRMGVSTLAPRGDWYK